MGSKHGTVTLVLDGEDKDTTSLSGVAATGKHLFLAPDEGAAVLRLRRGADGGYEHPERFDVDALTDPVVVPRGDDELDLEGMDCGGGALWVLGSHSGVRTRVKKHTPADEIPGVLRDVTFPPRRQVLIRIALADSGDGPVPQRVGTAALGPGDGGLRAALAGDPLLEPFLGLPGKDNGLDIEGLVVLGDRVLLGLRGPVLRGWAVVVEIRPRPVADDLTRLELAPLDAADPAAGRYRTHVLDLGGLGIRDLARHGDDLLVLTGPTMVLDGPARILRLRRGAVDPMPPAVLADDLDVVVEDLPTDEGHPEGLTVVHDDRPWLLVCDDGPSGHRLDGTTVLADRVDLR
jgi:hypothetical protein